MLARFKHSRDIKEPSSSQDWPLTIPNPCTDLQLANICCLSHFKVSAIINQVRKEGEENIPIVPNEPTEPCHWIVDVQTEPDLWPGQAGCLWMECYGSTCPSVLFHCLCLHPVSFHLTNPFSNAFLI